MNEAPPITTLTLFRFPRKERLWAFVQMALARPLLRRIPGLRFRKLMGTGRGIGFTRKPDWNRYALLAVWQDEASARAFLASSRFMRRYRKHTSGEGTLLLRTLQAYGNWDGMNPFLPTVRREAGTERIAVLTRATIRPMQLRSFWGMVEPVSNDLARAKGLLGSIGMGELPFIRQGTLSIWESTERMKAFAYSLGVHKDVVRRTAEEGWYSEELFARFEIIGEIGTVFG